MRKQKIKTGFTLTELLTVIAIIVLLVAIGVPAAREVLESFESSVGVRHLISSALGSARAIAASQQKYAGLRFQQDLDGNQYMIFIVHDEPATNLAYGFRAVGGYKPMKLPRSVGVMDLKLVSRTYYGTGELEIADDIVINHDDLIDELEEINETTTFSIIFSPAGKLVTHLIWVRNKDGIPDSTGEIGNDSDDEVFNKKDVVDTGDAMFYQDDYSGSPTAQYPDELGFGPERSRNNFVVYNKREFESVDTESRWTDYLQYLEVVYVSPYTGQIINR